MAVHRCQHLKTTGQQCGSPAMRAQTFCYFHHRWKAQYAVINEAHTEHTPGGLILPVLEDYESIQMAIMQVLQTLTTGHLDTKTAGLLLYGLQIASSNLRHAQFEPRAESVVINLNDVQHTPLDADQWEAEDEGNEEEDGETEEEAENEEACGQATASLVETGLSPLSGGATKEEEEPDNLQAAAEKPEPEIKPSPGKSQPAISDADFLRALAGLADHIENGAPLKLPVYPKPGGTDTPVRQKRPPATTRTGTSGKRRKGNRGS